MLFVPAEPRILQIAYAHFGETKRLVKFPIRQLTGVGCDLATQEFELQAAVKTDSQIVVFALHLTVASNAYSRSFYVKVTEYLTLPMKSFISEVIAP